MVEKEISITHGWKKGKNGISSVWGIQMNTCYMYSIFQSWTICNNADKNGINASLATVIIIILQFVTAAFAFLVKKTIEPSVCKHILQQLKIHKAVRAVKQTKIDPFFESIQNSCRVPMMHRSCLPKHLISYKILMFRLLACIFFCNFCCHAISPYFANKTRYTLYCCRQCRLQCCSLSYHPPYRITSSQL